MIEITKRMKHPVIKTWKGVCRECKSEAKCIGSDLTHYDYHPELGYHSWEVCPVCGAGKYYNGQGGLCFKEEEVIEVKHCKCGSALLKMNSAQNSDGSIYWITCRSCGYTGEQCFSEKHAEAAWR